MQQTLNVSDLQFYVRSWGDWIWNRWAHAHQASIIHQHNLQLLMGKDWLVLQILEALKVLSVLADC